MVGGIDGDFNIGVLEPNWQECFGKVRILLNIYVIHSDVNLFVGSIVIVAKFFFELVVSGGIS